MGDAADMILEQLVDEPQEQCERCKRWIPDEMLMFGCPVCEERDEIRKQLGRLKT